MAKSPMTLKVTVADTWQTVLIDGAPDQTVASVKSRALTTENIAPATFSSYEVKFGGAPVRDESRTLQALGAKDGSPFIVLLKRRRAVR
jgi:hypothetical protein